MSSAGGELPPAMGRRIALRLVYDGSRYSGWQLQPGRATVQGTLAEAIRSVSGEEILPKGASRTDAGVHALDQVAAFTSTSGHTAEVWVKALNALLPTDITVREGCEVALDFNPVTAAIRKRYRYRIHDASWRPVLQRHLVWHWRGRLDVDRMREAAMALVGEHDFTSFESSLSPRQSKIRTIHALTVGRPPLADDAAESEVWIEVEGNGFLYNMVLIIAGSLAVVGAGKRPPEWLGQALAARRRPAAGPTAPPQGLVLAKSDLEAGWQTSPKASELGIWRSFPNNSAP
ncbi:MAG: tRNA pseudouridine(38-40) synthase TruA [Pirellulales bacterium]